MNVLSYRVNVTLNYYRVGYQLFTLHPAASDMLYELIKCNIETIVNGVTIYKWSLSW